MAVNRYDDRRAWYAISTYSGYEDKVADSINQRTGTVEMADKIFEAIVPKEKQIEIKNGKRKIVDRKILQGYLLFRNLLPQLLYDVVLLLQIACSTIFRFIFKLHTVLLPNIQAFYFQQPLYTKAPILERLKYFYLIRHTRLQPLITYRRYHYRQSCLYQ